MSSSFTAAKQREIQEQVAEVDDQEPRQNEGAMQAGARIYPEPPFPRQHQDKPGDETALSPPTYYDAPFYIGSQKLQDKVALITGGDSGIGRSVAVLFAREGADVAIVHLDEGEDAAITAEAVRKEGRRCWVVQGDVKESEFCRQAVAETVYQFGKLDILVNNSAFQVHTYDIVDLTEDHFDETLKTNLYGYFHMARAAVPHLKAGSAIINTGSVTGFDGEKSLLDYSMTKGGIHAFTKSLASQLIPKGIRVNCVAPGPVWSPLNPSDKEPDKVSQFGSGVPMKRPAQPEEIAPAYVFLASPQCSSFITGEILPIVGGY